MGYLATTPQKMEPILFLATINERKQGTGNISKNSACYLLVFELRSVFSHIDQEAVQHPSLCLVSSYKQCPCWSADRRASCSCGCWLLVVSRTRCPGRWGSGKVFIPWISGKVASGKPLLNRRQPGGPFLPPIVRFQRILEQVVDCRQC